MTKVALHIPDDLQVFVEESVKAGLFNDAADFMVNLLYQIRSHQKGSLSDTEEKRLGTLRMDIRVGTEQADRREFVEFSADGIIAEGRRMFPAI